MGNTSDEAGAAATPDQLFLAFAQEVLAHFARWVSAEPVAFKQVLVIVNQQPPGSQYGWQLDRDYSSVLSRHVADIQSLPTVEPCVLAHQEAGFLDLQITPADASSQLVLRMLQPIRDILAEHRTVAPAPEDIMNTYYKVRDTWRASRVIWDVVVPLINVKGELQQEVPVSLHLRLAPLTLSERVRLWNYTSYPSFSAFQDFHQFISAECALIGSYDHDRDEAHDPRMITAEVGQVITALRLLKTGPVGAPALYERASGAFPLPGIWSVTSPQGHRVSELISSYVLTASDVIAVQTLSKALATLASDPHHGGLGVALRRFNQAYTRDMNVEDRIIDLTIALESSLLFRQSDELKFRLALRGITLLAGTPERTTPDSLQEVRKILGVLYDVRSKIVHEGQSLEEQAKSVRKALPHMQSGDFYLCCENIVRDILRTYVVSMTKQGSFKRVGEVNDELDGSVTAAIASASVASGD